MVNALDFKNITFPVSKKDYKKIEQKSNICINVLLWKWFNLSCSCIRIKVWRLHGFIVD